MVPVGVAAVQADAVAAPVALVDAVVVRVGAAADVVAGSVRTRSSRTA